MLRSLPGAGHGHQMVVHGEHPELVVVDREVLLDPVVALATDSPGVEVRLARVDAEHARARVHQLDAACAEQVREVLVADVARVVVAHQHHSTVARDPVDEVVRQFELVMETHVGEVAGHNHDVRAQQIELVDDALGERGDVIARPAVQVGDVRDDGRCSHAASPRLVHGR